jgi:hypothetical protein
VFEDLVQRLKAIEQESGKRLERADHAGEIQAKSVFMLFESAPAVPPSESITAPRPERTSAETAS